MTYAEAPQNEMGEIRRYLRALHPRELLAMGNGMPVVIKQLVQLLFMLCWPFWAVAGLMVGVIYYGILYPVLWVLFWPVRHFLADKGTDDKNRVPTSRP